KTAPTENQISRCLPRDSTSATWLPTTPSAVARASMLATPDRKPLTVLPTRTPESVRALWAIVSPSGIVARSTAHPTLPLSVTPALVIAWQARGAVRCTCSARDGGKRDRLKDRGG